jgi:hypothetical protein
VTGLTAAHDKAVLASNNKIAILRISRNGRIDVRLDNSRKTMSGK